MAWTSPLTAVSNAALTAAQWNASVRDDMNETAPAKATAAGRIFVSTGANAIAERVISRASVATSETTATTTYTNLTTPGPAVTATSGTRALVILSAQLSNNTISAFAVAGVTISGATSDAAVDDRSLMQQSAVANVGIGASRMTLFDSLTAGSNTFTMQYRVSAGTGTFVNRHIAVIPL